MEKYEKFRFLLHYDTDIISYEEFCEEFAIDSAAHKYQYLVEKKEKRGAYWLYIR